MVYKFWRVSFVLFRHGIHSKFAFVEYGWVINFNGKFWCWHYDYGMVE